MTNTQSSTPLWVRIVNTGKVAILAGLAAALLVLNHLAAPTLALTTLPAATPSSMQARTEDPLRCKVFLVHGDTAWYRAQQHLSKTYRVGGPLDSDLDGYACESLAKYTAALNEPDCYRSILKPWKKDCSARTQYRTITHLTSHEDADAIRAALLDVYAPYAENGVTSEVVRDALVEAMSCASTESITEMQRFIRTEHTRNETVQAFTGLLGLGDKILSRKKSLGADYYKIIDVYLDAATSLAEWGTSVQLSDTARTKLVASYTGRSCQG